MATLTLRAPNENSPGYLRFWREMPAAVESLRALQAKAKAGEFLTPREVDAVVDALVLFMPNEDRDVAREAILDASATELATALTTIDTESLLARLRA